MFNLVLLGGLLSFLMCVVVFCLGYVLIDFVCNL